MGSALEKAIALLEAVAGSSRTLGLSDLAGQTGLSRQTAHRVLRQLEANGLLLHEPVREHYLVGHRLKQLSLSALSASQRTGASHEVLRKLVARIGETCNVGILDDRDVIYLDRVECNWPLRLQLQPGSRLPAHCSAIGKLLLAYMAPRARRRLLGRAPFASYTPHTITDPHRLEEQMESIREQAVSINAQEYFLGMLGIAVPVRDSGDRVVAALAVHAPQARMDEAQARSYLPDLRAAAAELGQALESNVGDEL